MHLSSCPCCDPLHVTAVHVQTVYVLRRHRCIHVHRVDWMHIGCTTTNMDYTTRPGAVTASVHVIKKMRGEENENLEPLYTSGHLLRRHIGSEKQVDHSTFRPPEGRSVRVSLYGALTYEVCSRSSSLLYRCFSRAKKMMCGCYTASILSSYHPLPTTKRRLTLRRPEAWSASFISPESGLSYTKEVYLT